MNRNRKLTEVYDSVAKKAQLTTLISADQEEEQKKF